MRYACDGGCHDRCLAMPIERCHGFQCTRDHCTLFAAAPSTTVTRALAECWARLAVDEAQLAGEGLAVPTQVSQFAKNGRPQQIDRVTGFSATTAAAVPGEVAAMVDQCTTKGRSLPIVRFAMLPRHCAFGLLGASLAGGGSGLRHQCFIDDVRFHGNTRPVVSMLDAWGEVRGVYHAGYWRPYWWDSVGDDAGPVPALSGALQAATTMQTGHDVIDHVRIVYVRNATATPGGNLCDGARCYTDPQSFQGDPAHPILSPREGTGCKRIQELHSHLIVLVQDFGASFSHIIFQILPQLAAQLESVDRLADGSDGALLRDLLPLKVLVTGRRGPFAGLAKAAFGLSDDQIVKGEAGTYVTAPSASMLLTPPGINPNEAIFGRGILRRAYVGLALPLPDDEPNDLVVYMYRTRSMGRNVVNEMQLTERVATWLKPQYRMVMTGPHQHNNSWLEFRNVLRRARVLMGPHGSAWGNMIFAPMHRSNMHFIEFHSVRGRTCYPKVNHYVNGLSHYWTLEPTMGTELTGRDPANQWLTSQGLSMGMHSINAPMTIPLDDLHTILWHAGVVDCQRAGNYSSTSYRCSRWPLADNETRPGMWSRPQPRATPPCSYGATQAPCSWICKDGHKSRASCGESWTTPSAG